METTVSARLQSKIQNATLEFGAKLEIRKTDNEITFLKAFYFEFAFQLLTQSTFERREREKINFFSVAVKMSSALSFIAAETFSFF